MITSTGSQACIERAIRIVEGQETAPDGVAIPTTVVGFHMRADEAFLKDLDDLRAQERPLLSRADYVRKLVADAKMRGLVKGKRK